MAVEMFLKVDEVDGESTNDRHQNWIRIESFSWGAIQPVDRGVGEGGKVQFQDIHFTKKLDKSSPTLAYFCATGQHIKSAQLSLSRSDAAARESFYIVKMSDVLISSYEQRADELPTDQFALNYAKIEVVYRPQRDDGSLDSPVRFAF